MTNLQITCSNGNLISPAVIPKGLQQHSNFISEGESKNLLDLISQNEWSFEGFEERRRVQRFQMLTQNHDNGTGISPCELYSQLEHLVDRILSTLSEGSDDSDISLSKLRVNEIVIEERKYTPITKSLFYQNQIKQRPTASTFDSHLYSKDEKCMHCYMDANNNQSDEDRKCACYVAQLCLVKSCTLSMNKPKRRNVECWDLESPNHCVDVHMNPNGLVIKQGESLWNWRSRIIEVNKNADNVDDHYFQEENSCNGITIKFRCIQGEKLKAARSLVSAEENDNECKNSESGTNISPQATTLPLHELLTIVVTTSPIKSNPSTEVLENTFSTFIYGGFDFCYNCEKVIICDGVRIQTDEDISESSSSSKLGKVDRIITSQSSQKNREKDSGSAKDKKPTVTKKHSNVKQKLRNGIATQDQAQHYDLFKERLDQICKDAGSGLIAEEEVNESKHRYSPFRNTRVVPLEERHGYGYALRHALRHEVRTPFVCVIQHDRTFMRQTPITEVVNCMRNSEETVKYVGMNMRSNLCYRDIFTTKYGVGAFNELLDMVVKPPELSLDAATYGPTGVSVDDMAVHNKTDSAKLEKNLVSLAQTYRGTIQCISNCGDTLTENQSTHQLSLTPTLFWYDNTHVCQTSHYRDFIFDPKYKMVARGGFVEDKLSPVITRSVERLGLKNGHAKFGCYLLDDHSGFFFTGHLDGGSYMTMEQKQLLVAKNTAKP